VFYAIDDPEFLREKGWRLSDIENLHCTTADVWDESHTTRMIQADNLPGFSCVAQSLILRIKRARV
jgi:hypothetical protein